MKTAHDENRDLRGNAFDDTDKLGILADDDGNRTTHSKWEHEHIVRTSIYEDRSKIFESFSAMAATVITAARTRCHAAFFAASDMV